MADAASDPGSEPQVVEERDRLEEEQQLGGSERAESVEAPALAEPHRSDATSSMPAAAETTSEQQSSDAVADASADDVNAATSTELLKQEGGTAEGTDEAGKKQKRRKGKQAATNEGDSAPSKSGKQASDDAGGDAKKKKKKKKPAEQDAAAVASGSSSQNLDAASRSDSASAADGVPSRRPTGLSVDVSGGPSGDSSEAFSPIDLLKKRRSMLQEQQTTSSPTPLTIDIEAPPSRPPPPSSQPGQASRLEFGIRGRSLRDFANMIFDFDTAEAVAQMAEQPASMIEMGDLGPSEPASPTTPMRVNLREPSALTLPRTKTLSGVTLPRHASVSLSRSTSGEVAVTSERPRAYHVGALSVVAYIAALFFLLAVSLGYTLLDIVISNKFQVNLQPSPGVFETSVGLISVSLDFLWKLAACVYAFPLAVSRKTGKYNWFKIAVLAVGGSVLHMGSIAFVRAPAAVAGGFGNVMPEASIASTLFYLLVTMVLDFIALPLYFRREHNRLAPEELRLPRRSGRTGLLALTYLWIAAWIIVVLCDFHVRLDFAKAGLAQDLILWLPFVLIFVALVRDPPNEAYGSATYLALYLWLLSLLPFFAGSVLSLFRDINISGVRFIVTLAYIAILQLMFSVVVGVSKNMTHAASYVIFLFMQQFFDNFFGTLFFIDTRLSSDYLPWLILAFQSAWIIVRNSGLSKDLTLFILFKLQPKLQDVVLFRFISNITFEAGHPRLRNQAKLASQYIICDAISLVSIPVQYFYYSSTLAPALVESYATNYGMTLEQHWTGELAIRFAIIGAVKLVAHVVAFALLAFKIRQYNRECDKYNLKPVHTGKTLVKHLSKNWLFLAIMCVEVMRLSYFMLSALLIAPGFPLDSDLRGKFWWVVNFLNLGYRA